MSHAERSQGNGPTSPPAPLTHWISYDAPGYRRKEALCGVYLPANEYALQPTCPACQRLLAELDDMEL